MIMELNMNYDCPICWNDEIEAESDGDIRVCPACGAKLVLIWDETPEGEPALGFVVYEKFESYSDKCFLGRSNFNQCCCVCRNRVRIVDDGMRPSGKFVCVLPLEMEGESTFVIDCEEHSAGCECWDDKRRKNERK
jgi:hypothetical protein